MAPRLFFLNVSKIGGGAQDIGYRQFLLASILGVQPGIILISLSFCECPPRQRGLLDIATFGAEGIHIHINGLFVFFCHVFFVMFEGGYSDKLRKPCDVRVISPSGS